ncbi:MAG: hypothetical protein UT34_C0001G0465 [candidate division WS6 bacterium GW2011_GWF2_39_15]|uniref:Uncharacterized protein n=1 Tax=candidate division WS6 bacterium GW2011_GWF2_39_15 TaxID=1619100 RepID=A0A0G0Q7J6_9BACT|nr:MAG: hypothetical protein UT34_C0001G0465 [candidate division WS6 bacterium GW2011_GWF2_39_15]
MAIRSLTQKEGSGCFLFGMEAMTRNEGKFDPIIIGRDLSKLEEGLVNQVRNLPAALNSLHEKMTLGGDSYAIEDDMSALYGDLRNLSFSAITALMSVETKFTTMTLLENSPTGCNAVVIDNPNVDLFACYLDGKGILFFRKGNKFDSNSVANGLRDSHYPDRYIVENARGHLVCWVNDYGTLFTPQEYLDFFEEDYKD